MRIRPPTAPTLVGIFIGLAAALVAISTVRAHPLEPAPMLPDFGGPVRKVVMQYAKGSQFIAPVFRDYLKWQSPALTVYLACPEKEDFDEAMALLADIHPKCAFVPVYTHHTMTSWSRDRWVALIGDKTGLTLLSPQSEQGQEVWPERAGDSHIGDDLARALPDIFHARRSHFYFDGGDFLADDGNVFITRAVLLRNIQHTAQTRDDLLKDMSRELSLRPIFLDDGPDHHAGMFMMSAGPGPDGKRIMVVADPSLGKSLYNASPENDALFDGGGPDFSPENQARFDFAAKTIENVGYHVVRIPVAPGHGIRYQTYVNVILDREAATPVVYMSAYQGQEKMNAAAQSVWQSLGYTVRPVDCTTVWQKGGTLHCLVNVFQRDP